MLFGLSWIGTFGVNGDTAWMGVSYYRVPQSRSVEKHLKSSEGVVGIVVGGRTRIARWIDTHDQTDLLTASSSLIDARKAGVKLASTAYKRWQTWSTLGLRKSKHSQADRDKERDTPPINKVAFGLPYPGLRIYHC